VTITETKGAFELAFDISGHDNAPVVIELSFRRGGQFTGVKPTAEPQVYLLEQGTGSYRVGADVIEFGPGRVEHERLNVEGASYTAHRGSSRTGGDCVYLTGYTPFRQRVVIK
jgi:hypothetical protein